MLQFFRKLYIDASLTKNYRKLLMKERRSFIGFFCGSYENAPFARKIMWNIQDELWVTLKYRVLFI